MGWVKEAGLNLKDVPEVDEEPEITDLDERFWEELFPPKLSHELQIFVGNKRRKVWIWTAVNHWRPGIIAWTIGDSSFFNVSIALASSQVLAKFLVCH